MSVTAADKICSIFPEKGIVVDKGLVNLGDNFKKLPSFVVDYLISEMVNPEDPQIGIRKISELLENHFMESDQKELIKSKIRENGQYTLIGRIMCRFDESKDEYWVDVSALGNQYIRIDKDIIEEYGETILTTGAWGVFTIVYDDSFKMRNKLYPFLITKFKPMQITNIDINSWIERREKFTDDEWLDIIITSIGFDPEYFSAEEKMMYIVRLIPFIESNVNMVELGPPETGKTFAYQSLSSYGFVASGGQTTVASLFYNKLKRQLGLIGYRDVVMFDEFASHRGGNKWSGQDDLVDILKDFMNSGQFGRGTAEFSSGCSIMFAGNIDCDRTNKTVSSRYRMLFSPLPQIINTDRAFLDRINGFIPGWRVPQISESKLAQSHGFMADYFSEIMHRMRNRSYANVISNNVEFGDMTRRNQMSLIRIGSGLIKLIFPHRTSDTIKSEELVKVMDIAIDLRQRVVDQLAIISPKEFSGVKLSYNIRN